ncbi:MAG: hypothetical protein H6734_09050 [Alphaproteobacteria bacterium]|nr:hypothetical protein [Alphaproteobacteria bacterium]
MTALPRLHLFELADQPWFPRTLADAGTAYLATLQEKAGLGAVVAPLVERGLALSGATRIVDLCSGGGGPLLAAREHLAAPVPVVLTDLQPNVWADRTGPGITVHPEPVDATAVPAELAGLRTVFNALHHFRPEGARAVLRDAQEAGQPILVVELSERGLLPLTVGTLFIPLVVLFVMPLVRPVRPLWLVLTWLLPVLPLTIAWDGWVSHWRTYGPEDLDALVAPLAREGWVWEHGRDPAGPGHVTWLLGRPEVTPRSSGA